VTEARDGVVKIETDFAGTLMVSTDQIESMRTQQPTVVLLADETVIRDQPLQVEGRPESASPEGRKGTGASVGGGGNGCQKDRRAHSAAPSFPIPAGGPQLRWVAAGRRLIS